MVKLKPQPCLKESNLLKLRAIGLFLLVLLVHLLIFASVSFAFKLNEGSESQQTNSKIEERKKQLSQLSKEEKQVLKELVVLDSSLENTKKSLEDLNEKLDSTKGKINLLQEKLDEAQGELDGRITRLNKRAVQIYKQGDNSYFDVVLFSRSFSDFINRVGFLTLILKQDTYLIRTIKDNKKRLDYLKQNLELKYAQQWRLKEDKEEAKKAIEGKTRQKQRYLERIRAEKKVSEEKVASLQKEAQNIREMMRRFGTSEVIPAGTKMRVRATGYAGNCDLCGSHGVTSTGLKAEYGIAAVSRDPNKRVVPLGTKIYVESYGEALVADVGGGVKEDQIDLAFETHQEAMNWGVKWVTITILK